MAEKPIFTVGERIEQMCITCGEERGHIVASVTKKGRITRVSCPGCGSRPDRGPCRQTILQKKRPDHPVIDCGPKSGPIPPRGRPGRA